MGPILGGAIDVPETIAGLKNGDKILVLFVWFGMAFANIYFMKKVFGDYNLPWTHMPKNPPVLEGPTKLYSIYLKIQAAFWIPIFPVGYTLKWGVAWHNAGPPLEPFWNAHFHPYP